MSDLNANWAYRKEAAALRVLVARESAESICVQRFTDDRASRRSHRSHNKQLKDRAHGERRKEKQRIFDEAHHDVIDSPGEVDALTNSKVLRIERADVLRDPKLRTPANGYTHAFLRG